MIHMKVLNSRSKHQSSTSIRYGSSSHFPQHKGFFQILKMDKPNKMNAHGKKSLLQSLIKTIYHLSVSFQFTGLAKQLSKCHKGILKARRNNNEVLNYVLIKYIKSKKINFV